MPKTHLKMFSVWKVRHVAIVENDNLYLYLASGNQGGENVSQLDELSGCFSACKPSLSVGSVVHEGNYSYLRRR